MSKTKQFSRAARTLLPPPPVFGPGPRVEAGGDQGMVSGTRLAHLDPPASKVSGGVRPHFPRRRAARGKCYQLIPSAASPGFEGGPRRGPRGFSNARSPGGPLRTRSLRGETGSPPTPPNNLVFGIRKRFAYRLSGSADLRPRISRDWCPPNPPKVYTELSLLQPREAT